MFLTSDLTHAAVIERSAPIKVTTNREYHLGSFFSSVPSCYENEVMPINVRQPKCSGADDKIRVYGQGKSVGRPKESKNNTVMLNFGGTCKH